ncbi:four helix bundle protein [Niabella drilacis]|uniref:Four helix bundle protein n=1 Tax=Niabella drilacis (strain DSM 25811 / CCM 8410 / CCUG 62505 / LMG 26954 / E90) TaxID=1285928 RepID=A0A1G6NNE6_NIADE|nr:four helix bundle protein [Niabella drilacis]SDC68894.1 four helix bundle protein [Niabella drilacis]
MAFKFENLKVWHSAANLSNQIDSLTKGFPPEEKYSLSTQMKKAADSVALNIAEGSTGQTNAEFKRFLGFSLRSAVEVVSALLLARMRNYITEEIKQKYYDEYEMLCKMITSLRASM